MLDFLMYPKQNFLTTTSKTTSSNTLPSNTNLTLSPDLPPSSPFLRAHLIFALPPPLSPLPPSSPRSFTPNPAPVLLPSPVSLLFRHSLTPSPFPLTPFFLIPQSHSFPPSPLILPALTSHCLTTYDGPCNSVPAHYHPTSGLFYAPYQPAFCGTSDNSLTPEL